MTVFWEVLAALAAAATLCWAGVALHPARPWDLRPVDEDEPDPPEPAGDAWPSVAVLVPARNECDTLPATLRSLLAQDYPGRLSVVLVDDRSADGTGDVARRIGARHGGGALEVVQGSALPDGWVGKVWALEQARVRAGDADLFLLTDADIRHAPGSVRRLACDAQARGLGLTSRMARLHCESPVERLLIPPFVLFFLLLYPPRLANRPRSRVAAAAGGCILVRREVLEQAGGFAAIRGALIDDLALAARVKRSTGRPVRLALSRGRVTSVRDYRSLGPLWHMVRRSAFTQLRRSWALLAAVLAVLAVMSLVPPVAVAAGAVGLAAGAGAPAGVALAGGAAAWALSAVVAGPAAREYGLSWGWRLALPLAGALYGGMTLDSALRGPRGGGWR